MAVPAPEAIAFAVRGPIARDDLPGLCDRVCGLLAQSHARVALCDVEEVEPDAVTVEALARLQLTARRLGRRIELRSGTPELARLLAFVGLSDVLGLGLRRQPEEREEPRRVEERVDRGDAAP
jgi:ABC-type transporter Mla MlaB component